MSQTVRYSFIVLTHKRPALLQTVLNHHQLFDLEKSEVILVNNGKFHERIETRNATVIELGKNQGIAAGFNAGIRQSHGEIIFFMEDDILLPKGWMQEADLLYNHFQDIGLFGWNAEFRYDIRWEREEVYTPEKLLGEAHDELQEYALWFHTNGEIFGSCFTSRAAIDTIGFFDESLGTYGYERVDFGYRCHQLGFMNAYILKNGIVDRAEELERQPFPERDRLLAEHYKRYQKKMQTIQSMRQPPRHYFEWGKHG